MCVFVCAHMQRVVLTDKCHRNGESHTHTLTHQNCLHVCFLSCMTRTILFLQASHTHSHYIYVNKSVCLTLKKEGEGGPPFTKERKEDVVFVSHRCSISRQLFFLPHVFYSVFMTHCPVGEKKMFSFLRLF